MNLRTYLRMNKSGRKLLVLGFMLAACALAHAVCPIPEDIKPCTCDDEGLQCLKLNNTGLNHVFKANAERKAIRRVWIFHTNLTELTTNAFGDYIIRDLYLDLNQIRNIEAGAFGEATKTLQALSLTRNLLTSFPFEDLQSMRKLKAVGLGHNQLTVIPTNAFPASDTLESIDLSHNLIYKIEPFAFAELHEVSLIDLSRNFLRDIGSNALMVKSSSRRLLISLRGNRIQQVASNAFGDHHPDIVDLSRNQLTYLDPLTFAPLLFNDTRINVDENPFSCSGCDLYKWLIGLDKEVLNNLYNFACADDTKLEDLTLEMIGCTTTS